MYLGRVAVANTIIFYLLLDCFNNDLRPSCSVVLSDDLELQRLWNLLTKPSSAGLNPLKIVCKHGARRTISKTAIPVAIATAVNLK